eukprot:scaffold182362_cov26-Tisochrysis_lutea.AAC.9
MAVGSQMRVVRKVVVAGIFKALQHNALTRHHGCFLQLSCVIMIPRLLLAVSMMASGGIYELPEAFSAEKGRL